MLSLTLLAGIWTSTCIQTQLNGKQGFVKETYDFKSNGHYTFTRYWFEDADCKKTKDIDTEKGRVKIGEKLSGMMISGDTYEADFTTNSSKDLGSISVSKNILKIGRGLPNSTMRNTMLGIFEFKKQRAKKK